jgi:hypothetical protein
MAISTGAKLQGNPVPLQWLSDKYFMIFVGGKDWPFVLFKKANKNGYNFNSTRFRAKQMCPNNLDRPV